MNRDVAHFKVFLGRAARTLGATLPAQVGSKLASIMLNDVKKRFATSTAPDGKRWAPLKHARPDGGSKPLLDSGLLRGSIQATATKDGAVVFSNLPYARLQNEGGTIRAKRSKYLAIPLTKEAKRAGSPRRFKGDLKYRPFKQKGTGGVMYTRKNGKVIEQYLLVREVDIPARPFLGVSPSAAEQMDNVIADWIDAQLPRE